MAGKEVAQGTIFTIPLDNGAQAHAVVLYVLNDREFLMGVLENESVGDMTTLAQVCDAVHLLLYSGLGMLQDGTWRSVGRIELPDTTPLTERIGAGLVKLGNKAVRRVSDKAERETFVSGNTGGQRFVENLVQEYFGEGERSRSTTRTATTSAALLARCRNL